MGWAVIPLLQRGGGFWNGCATTLESAEKQWLGNGRSSVTEHYLPNRSTSYKSLIETSRSSR